MLKESLPVIFSRLCEVRAAQPNAIIIFNAFDPPADYIATIIEKGLNSGCHKILGKNIDSLFRNGYASNKAHVLSNINVCLAQKDNRIKLADLLLNSSEAMGQIKSASYLHHNGFRKIVLLSTNYFKLRLHVFEAVGQNIAQENIHDHRWPFSSICLEGEIICKIFESEADNNSEFFHYKYSPVGSAESYSVEPNGTDSLQASSRLIIEHGTGYHLPEETLHRVINDSNKRVITLVITGTPIKETCNLYSEREFEQEEHSIERFDEVEIENAITELKFF